MKNVYIDVLFFINFFIDLSLLIFTAIYCTRKIVKYRFFIAASLGAIYGIAWLLYSNMFLYSIFGKLLFSFLLIRIAFPWENVKVYFKTIITFYVINFLTAGAILTFQLVLINNKDLYNQWIEFGEYNIWIFEATVTSIVIGLPIAYLSVKNMWLYIKNLPLEKSCLYKCRLHYNGNIIHFIGLFDTGNQLVDPITNQPVSIVEFGILRKVLPSFANTIYAEGNVNIANIDQIINNKSIADNFTIIPYRAIGSIDQYLLAFKAEIIIIETKEGDIYQKNCLIAITNQGLSNTGKFNGIIHPQLLDGTLCKREELLNDYNSKKNVHSIQT